MEPHSNFAVYIIPDGFPVELFSPAPDADMDKVELVVGITSDNLFAFDPADGLWAKTGLCSWTRKLMAIKEIIAAATKTMEDLCQFFTKSIKFF